MDSLGEILNSIHFSGSLWCKTEARSPWGMHIPRTDNAQFHFLLRGSAYIRPEFSREFIPLESGDLVVLTQGHAHDLLDNPDTDPILLQTLLERSRTDEPGMRIGGDGGVTTLVCGYFSIEKSIFHPLFSSLPKIMLLRGEENRSLPWLETILSFISAESAADRPASQPLINRLTEILFILLLRAHLRQQDSLQKSWLKGLKDPLIGEAMKSIHTSPEKQWTIDSLAKASGMSRANFSMKFKNLVGESPFQYLTKWRLFRASNLLMQKDLTLAEIAGKVGYGNEASFSKVFRKHTGKSPGRYRLEIA